MFKYSSDQDCDPNDVHHRLDNFVISVMMCPVFIRIDNEYAWINSAPNSSKSCRPLSIIIDKENPELTRKIHSETLQKIDEISSHDAVHFLGLGSDYSLSFDAKFVMLDGQAMNHIFANKDTLKCFVCGKRGKDLLDSNVVYTVQDQDKLKAGMKPLHTMLRTFEKLLQIRYKKGLFMQKKNEVPECVFQWMRDQNKLILKTNKLEVHQKFWNVLKLDVDRPRQGFGTTTDGNTARKAFEHFQETSKILEIDERILKSFNLLFSLMYSQEIVDLVQFRRCTKNILELWKDLLPGENITPSIHLIVMHGGDIIENLHKRPGMFTEEGLEANHKEIRKAKTSFSRLMSREENLRDTIKRIFFNFYFL